MNVKKYVRALLCLYLSLIFSNTQAQALKVGDTLPPELWSMPLQVINHPEGKETITLSEYKDKLIILDFWATWCSPCIKSLNKLDTLQKEFSEELAVVPVTYEASEKVQVMFKKRGWSLPTVVNDSLLKNYFPHRSVPHQVWVEDGKVMAVAGPEYATKDNITKILSRQNVKILMKEDVLDISTAATLPPYYQSSFSPRIKNYTSEIIGNKNNINAYNLSLKTLIQEAYGSDFSLSQLNSLLVWEVSDALKQELTGEGTGLQGDYQKDSLYNQWLDQNLFCYTLTASPAMKPTRHILREIMKNDINTFMGLIKGIKISVEPRTIEHLVLKKQRDVSTSPLSSSESLQKILPYALVNVLSYEWGIPIVYNSPQHPSDSLFLDFSALEKESIKQQLSLQGFSLQPQQLETNVIIISEIKAHKP